MTIAMTKPALVVLTNTALIHKPWRSQSSTTTTNPSTMSEEEAMLHAICTGYDIKEVAYIWKKLHKDHDMKIEFASPRGGEPPVDPVSLREAMKDPESREFFNDMHGLEQLKNTKPLDHVQPNEYSCVLFPGCHGAMQDLPNNKKVQEIVCHIHKNNGWIATIGHGIAALLNVKESNGEHFLKGKQVACFTNEEEREWKFDKVIPYSLEEKIKECGAKLQKGNPFKSLVVVDGHLITAQSLFSPREWVDKILEKMMS